MGLRTCLAGLLVAWLLPHAPGFGQVPAAEAPGGVPTLLNLVRDYERAPRGEPDPFERVIVGITAYVAANPDDELAYFYRALASAQAAVALEAQWALALQAQPLEEAGEAAAPDPAELRERTAAHYRRVEADLRRCFDGPQLGDRLRADPSAPLVQAISIVRLADFSGSADLLAARADLREQRRRLLGEARQTVGDYLANRAQTDLQRYRARFYLAIVEFKLGSVPVDGRRLSAEQTAQLEAARAEFETLTGEEGRALLAGGLRAANDEQIDAELLRWRSLARFYIALIDASQASVLRSELRRERLEAALAALQQAAQDAAADLPAEDRPTINLQDASTHADLRTRIGGNIGNILEQYREIANVLAAEGERGAAGDVLEPGMDFAVQYEIGLQFDGNVLLLGDNVAFPQGIGKKQDWRVFSQLRLSLEIDGGMIVPESAFAERWTIALEGRVNNGWMLSINDYDEGVYGGTAAVRYRLLDAGEDGLVGPVHLGLQYDYDHARLGRDPYLESHRLTGYISAQLLEQRLSMVGYARLEWLNYHERLYFDALNRDGEALAFGFQMDARLVDLNALWGEWAWGLPNDPQPGDADFARWLVLSNRWEWGQHSTAGSEYDHGYFLWRPGVLVPLPLGIDLDIGATFRWEDYWEASILDYRSKHQGSFSQQYDFGLSRVFVLMAGLPENRRTLVMDRLTMTLRGGVSLIVEDSNIQDRVGQRFFEYNRVLAGVSLAFAWN